MPMAQLRLSVLLASVVFSALLLHDADARIIAPARSAMPRCFVRDKVFFIGYFY
jgi:hypothetical protein